MRLSRWTRPSPLQVVQGSEIDSPVPRHSGQVDCWMKMPDCLPTTPRPPQVEQVRTPPELFEPVELHFAQGMLRSISSSFSTPRAASSRVISRS